MKKTSGTKTCRIKDLPNDFNLVGCFLKGREIRSGWNKGFWLKDSGERVIPCFFENFEAIKDWKVEVPKNRMEELKDIASK